MPAIPSTVKWNAALERFQDALTGRFVSFREAAEQVRRIEIKPGDFRLQDATGRFIGVSQFGVAKDFRWMSPNKGYLRFSQEVEVHEIGGLTRANLNKVTRYDYYKEGENVGTIHTSTGYGLRYEMDDYYNESAFSESGRRRIAEGLGIDPDEIDEVRISYVEYEYRTPIK